MKTLQQTPLLARGHPLPAMGEGRERGLLGIHLWIVALGLFFAALTVRAEPSAITDRSTGQEVAEFVRNAMPEATNSLKGTLIIKTDRQTRNVPVICRVVLRDDSWETDYDIAATNDSGAEQLRVIHRGNAANEYLYARAANPSASLPKPAPISPMEAAATPLGGSDFSAADLGLDFLHWPQQNRLKFEMRLGQPCYVLDSRDPSAGAVVRVKSYIDKESNAPIVAEGFDATDHEIKEFSLHGSSFKKVNGPLAPGEHGNSRQKKALAYGIEV